MTFNIRTAYIDDGENAWPNRRHWSLRPSNAQRPTSSVCRKSFASRSSIASALKDYRWIGVDRGLNGGQGLSATPIFYRFAELSPIESGNFWLSPTPDVPSTAEPRLGRIVTWARFHHRATGRQFYAFNTHFSPREAPGSSMPLGSSRSGSTDSRPGAPSSCWAISTRRRKRVLFGTS